MIAQLHGEIAEKDTDRLIINVAGVGYEVLFPASDLEKVAVGESISLHTYFHVRENAQELFGFNSSGAKALFKQLISVNGVGPKGAMAIIALGPEDEIRSAIASSNLAYIVAASGIGKKAAEKIVIDLKDKVGVLASSHGVMAKSVNQNDEALQALQALGYTAQQANQALAHAPADAKVEDRIRAALKELAR